MLLPEDLCDICTRHWPAEAGLTEPGDAGVVAERIAIVTALFDLGRGDWSKNQSETSRKFDRSVDDYFENFKRLTTLDNEMIIFISPHLADRALKLRADAGLAHRTFIFTISNLLDASELRTVRAAITRQSTATFRNFVWRPFVPEVNKPDYVLIMALKAAFANTAIKFGVVRAPQLAWIDFGYAHKDDLLDPGSEWTFDAGDKINLFNIYRLDDKPLYDVVRGGEVYFAGCHIVGPVGAWARFNRQISESLQSLIDCGFMDDDQTLMLVAWRREPDSFILRRYPVETDLGWRYIFKRYRTGLTSDVRDQDLPEVRRDRRPPWLRDLIITIRRWARRRSRGLG
jgi:protein YibB